MDFFFVKKTETLTTATTSSITLARDDLAAGRPAHRPPSPPLDFANILARRTKGSFSNFFSLAR
jgi:hypothetical protein